MIRIFVDANILFSAANPNSPLQRLLNDALLKGKLFSSHFALEEAKRNLVLKKPQWTSSFQQLIKRIELVSSAEIQLGVDLPKKDQPILAAAIQSACTHLVTGDKKHFGQFFGTSIRNVKILSPLQLAQEIE